MSSPSVHSLLTADGVGLEAVHRDRLLVHRVDAVVSVSAPGRWYSRETIPMRWVHRAVETRPGRGFARMAMRTRIAAAGCALVPEPPLPAVAGIEVRLLLVHGDQDAFLPLEHAESLLQAAAPPVELWVEVGRGHVETHTSAELADRIGRGIRHEVAQ